MLATAALQAGADRLRGAHRRDTSSCAAQSSRHWPRRASSTLPSRPGAAAANSPVANGRSSSASPTANRPPSPPAQLDLSEETVKTHTKNIMSRLGARNRTHAVAIALRESLIE